MTMTAPRFITNLNGCYFLGRKGYYALLKLSLGLFFGLLKWYLFRVKSHNYRYESKELDNRILVVMLTLELPGLSDANVISRLCRVILRVNKSE